MDKPKIFLLILLAIALLLSFCCEPVQAITEAEVQAQVDSVGKEKVSGNILIWFLCAIAFLKVSQKIDSFMSSIGINVGNTGGSLLSEAMIAARSFGAIRGGTGGRSGGSSGSPTGSSAGAASFFAGGLAGMVGRGVTNSAVKNVTTPVSGGSSGSGGFVGGKVYNASVSKGGEFANNVIGSVATGMSKPWVPSLARKPMKPSALIWAILLLRKVHRMFLPSEMWKLAVAESLARKSMPRIREESLSVCTIPSSICLRRVITPLSRQRTVLPGISSTRRMQ